MNSSRCEEFSAASAFEISATYPHSLFMCFYDYQTKERLFPQTLFNDWSFKRPQTVFSEGQTEYSYVIGINVILRRFPRPSESIKYRKCPNEDGCEMAESGLVWSQAAVSCDHRK
jgi:hypothetical protein